ncbi:MAG: DUF1127 domain-containing protein [Beijerinckiaceae bacterium]
MTHHARSGAAGSTFTLALVGVAVRAAHRIAAALKNRLQVRELYELDDRSLKDIGLMRTDVSAALDLPLHRDPSLHLVDVAGGSLGQRLERPAAAATSAGIMRLRRDDAAVKPAAMPANAACA